MKNTIGKQESIERTAPVETADAAPAQELFNPQEWEALLNSFENESTTAIESVTHARDPQIELSTDDLWERLSSTRWIRTPIVDGTDSTVAQRPAS